MQGKNYCFSITLRLDVFGSSRMSANLKKFIRDNADKSATEIVDTVVEG